MANRSEQDAIQRKVEEYRTRLDPAPPTQDFDHLADELSELTTTGSTAMTPDTEAHVVCVGDLPGQVLWPGSSYLVFDKTSKRVITLKGQSLSMEHVDENNNSSQKWLCVEKNGFFGLYNTKSRTYLGRGDGDSMQAKMPHFKDWEFFLPRRHPNGGYQLLSPHGNGGYHIKLLSLVDEGRVLVRTDHGDTLWDFQRV